MKKNNLSLFHILALLLAITAALPAHADDTEIYTSSALGTNSILPNVVFIIDTSGSMGDRVQVTVPPQTSSTSTATYDPSKTYTGSCDKDKIYISSSGTVPTGCNSYSDYFVPSLNYCHASLTPLATKGFYNASAVAYWHYNNWNPRKSKWRSVLRKQLTGSNSTEYVECDTDSGKNGGPPPYTSKFYATDGSNGPWDSRSSKEIRWSNYTKVSLYTGNYINYSSTVGGGTTTTGSTTTYSTRLKIVQDAFNSVIDATDNVNVAVMRYDTSAQGGYFIVPMMPLNATTRPIIKAAVDSLTPSGGTPLAETEYEAYLYFQGKPVRYGNSSHPGTDKSANQSITYPDGTTTTYDVLDSSQSKYVSPIQYQCQKNFTVLFTDGQPTSDGDADTAINNLLSSSGSGKSCSYSNNNDCLADLAGYMNDHDCRTDLSGKQQVTSYYIGGFAASGNTLLKSAATAGGGKYYSAADSVSVVSAFNAILTQIKEVNASFVSPAVAVNAFNRFTNMDQLYYGLFRPENYPLWNGNLKRYRLSGGSIVDVNGNAAVDPLTGFFSSTSTSWWTPTADSPDGADIRYGGAASVLSLPRNVYTYTGSASPSNVDLTTTSNAVSENNSAITTTMLGDSTMTNTHRTEVLQWARGVDLNDFNNNGSVTDARTQWGDVLHSEPVVVTYGGTVSSPDLTVFVGDNDGYLHAVNANDGTEYFSFIPQELLPNLPTLYDNYAGVAHPYGLDGSVTAWVNDVNGDGVIYDSSNALETGEGIYIYEGMRRGGSNYYALDVTDRSKPKLMWEIKGGSGDFAELGQSWSQPVAATVKLNGVATKVLFFAGGYDTAEDTADTVPTNDTIGRAIYMVNAKTGAKLWQAGPAGSGTSGADPNLVLSSMTNCIPSKIGVYDVNGDGYADTMFVGDTRGQLWRFDINNGNTGASNLVKGGVIASLGGTTAADNRKFYYPPSVSLSANGNSFNIAIGSGYRAHPTNKTIHDAFYVIHSPVTPPTNYSTVTPVTPADLYNATTNVAATSTTDVANLNGNGWYINLQNSSGGWDGEKVLSAALTLNGEVLFTTYSPVASSQQACAPSQGVALGYTVAVTNAAPVVNGVATTGVSPSTRAQTFTQTGIVPGPVVVIGSGGGLLSSSGGGSGGSGSSDCTVLAGTNIFKNCSFQSVLQKSYWTKQ